MATHGTIAAFSSSQETWTVYVERLEQHFAANKIGDADQQRAILLSVCRRATYRFICNLVSPMKPTELKIEELITLVQKHHDPKPSVIVRFDSMAITIVQESPLQLMLQSYASLQSTVSMVVPSVMC